MEEGGNKWPKVNFSPPLRPTAPLLWDIYVVRAKAVLLIGGKADGRDKREFRGQKDTRP